MAFLDPKPGRFREGMTQLRTSDLNKILAGVPRQLRGAGNVTVDYFGDRILINADSDQLHAAETTMQFVVLQEFGDYLLCTPFYQPSDKEGQEFAPQMYDASLGHDSKIQCYVAKPYLLQQTPWNGSSVTVNGQYVTYDYPSTGNRTYTTGSSSTKVSQQITPSYFPGDVILAIQSITGLKDSSGFPILWMDLNVAARQWMNAITPGAVSGALIASNTNVNVTLAPGPGTYLLSDHTPRTIFDNGGYTSGVTPYQFTAPSNGLYLVRSAVICFPNYGGGGGVLVVAFNIVQNTGTPKAISYDTHSINTSTASVTAMTLRSECVCMANAGDTFVAFVENLGSGNIELNNNNQPSPIDTFLSITKLS